VAAKKKVHRRKKQVTIPLAVVAGFMPATFRLSSDLTEVGTVKSFARVASRIFTGFDPGVPGKWEFRPMMQGTVPVLFGFLASRVATMVGVNRVIGRMGIPFLRI